MTNLAGIGDAAGQGGVKIFEWNRIDVSQFVSAGAMDFVAGGGGGAWSVTNVAERGNVLTYTPAGGTTVTEIAMFSDVISFPTERRDLVFEIEIYDGTFGAGSFFGVFFCADATPDHGFGHLGTGIAEAQTLLNNGAVERSAGTGASAGRFARYQIRGRKPAGAPPELSSYMEGFTANSLNGEPRRSGSTSAARGAVNEFGDASTLGATWNALNCDRFGLIVASSGGNSPPTQIRVLDFKVYRV